MTTGHNARVWVGGEEIAIAPGTLRFVRDRAMPLIAYVYHRGAVREFYSDTGEPVLCPGHYDRWSRTMNFEYKPTAIYDGFFRLTGHPDAEDIMTLEPKSGAVAN